MQERAASAATMLDSGNIERHRVGKRLGEMFVTGSQVQHFIGRKGNDPVRQMETQGSLQHHHHALRLMTVALRKCALLDLKAHDGDTAAHTEFFQAHSSFRRFDIVESHCVRPSFFLCYFSCGTYPPAAVLSTRASCSAAARQRFQSDAPTLPSQAA